MALSGCPQEVSPRVLYRPELALSVAVDLKVPRRARGGTPKWLGASLTLSEHRVLRRLVSWRDWLWSPLGSQPPDWHPPRGSCRTRGAGRKPARPPAALLAAWCRRPPLAPPPPRLPAARVSGIPLSRCLAVPLSCYREVPAWVLPLSSLGTAPTSGSPCPATQTSPQGGGGGGETLRAPGC